MKYRAISALLLAPILSNGAVAGCRHVDSDLSIITINDFSDRNYVHLDRKLGDAVCIEGRIVIDEFHGGVYFPLKTNANRKTLILGLSRILTGLSYNDAQRNAMVEGKIYKICGILRDATPFRKCDDNYCKWYRLESPEVQ